MYTRWTNGWRAPVPIVDPWGNKHVIQALLHEEALDSENFETEVVVDRLKHQGVMALYEDQDLVVAGANATRRLRPLWQPLGDTTFLPVRGLRILCRSTSSHTRNSHPLTRTS